MFSISSSHAIFRSPRQETGRAKRSSSLTLVEPPGSAHRTDVGTGLSQVLQAITEKKGMEVTQDEGPRGNKGRKSTVVLCHVQRKQIISKGFETTKMLQQLFFISNFFYYGNFKQMDTSRNGLNVCMPLSPKLSSLVMSFGGDQVMRMEPLGTGFNFSAYLKFFLTKCWRKRVLIFQRSY